MSAATAYIGLGANLPSRAGSPAQTIGAALGELSSTGIRVERVSRLYAGPAWPDASDPRFINAVAEIRTNLSPSDLLQCLHATETSFGRTRSERNAPRTLDLDVLDFDSRVEEGPPQLPHPRMSARAFVLLPLHEIAPRWSHPVTHQSLGELLSALPVSRVAAVQPVS